MSYVCGKVLDMGHGDGHMAQCLCMFGDSGATCSLLAGTDDGYVYTWEMDSFKPIHRLRVCVEGVSCILASPVCDHHVLVSAGVTVYTFDLRHFTSPTHHTQLGEEEINSISTRGNLLAMADDSGCVKTYDLSTNKSVRTFHKHTNICSAALFHPRLHHRLLSAGLDCLLVEYDLRKCRDVRHFDLASLGAVGGGSSPLANPPLLHCLLVSSPDTALCGAQDGQVHALSLAGRHLTHSRSTRCHRSSVNKMVAHGTGGGILTGGNDGDIHLWGGGTLLPPGPSQAGGPEITINHHRPVNDLLSLTTHNNNLLAVADVGSSISIYTHK